MSVLTNIPLAIINNIGFTAILFLVYQVAKSLQEKEILSIKAGYLFSMASIFQCIGLVQFIGVLFYPKFGSEIISNGLDFVNAGISSLFMQAPIEWLSFIGFIYCMVLVGLIIKTIFQFYQLSTLIKNSNFSDSDKYTSFIYNLPNASKDNKIKLGISATITTPISFGWIEPIILLPIALVNQLSVKEIESIILHEWAHILRNDYLINVITSLVQVILFFNPFSYLFNKEISLQREIACDSYVINASVEKIDYLNTLYKIATAMRSKEVIIQNTSKWTMGFLNMQNELLYRVKMLTKTNRFNFIHSSQLIFTTFIASLLFFIPFNKAQTKLETKLQPMVRLVSIKLPTNIKVRKPTPVFTSIHKHSHLLPKHHDENTAMVNWNEASRPSNLLNNSYDEMVQKTVNWIKTREVNNQFVKYQENTEAIELEVAEKLLMRTILTHYQFKRELLNDRLTNATDEKEAIDYVMNSKEWQQMQQFEKWTAEFLKKHPLPEDTTTLASLNARLIVY
ncbi:MAG: M56 family metallopeptidase [Sediminibacterium sp.]|jgi:beta-lactamase regulating signal transducer with metallopeptidase domain|nr:MAG: M56 family metallopeptidase [Sediminibacterium sp.]